ncbi:GGDEF domain-containing protein [Fusibacter bizertensis]
MRDAIYKNIHVYMGVCGLLISSIFYFLYKNIKPPFHDYYWMSVIASLTVMSIFCGKWIKNLMYYAYKDTLTNLYNRRYLYEKLEFELKRLNRSKTELSLVIIDIDHFKKVNDKYGHLGGDKLLKRVSEIFKINSREIDTIARWGGEEFAIIFPDTNNQDALKYAERLRNTIEKSEECYGVTVCIGVATTDKPIAIDLLFAEADKALFQAKSVRNKVVGANFTLCEFSIN